MADWQHPAARPPADAPSILQTLHDHAPSSIQLIGVATLVISGGILLLLAGLTVVAAAAIGFAVIGPVILISSPVWVPAGALILVAAAGFLSSIGFVATVVAAAMWIYRYLRGLEPPGSGQVDYARSRFADTAGHVKEYTREYGGYLHNKVVRDAAPSA